MALRNRDRIDRAFTELAAALDEFITRVVESHIPDGKDWTLLLALKDTKKGAQGKAYSRLDVQPQLRMLTENVTGTAKQGWYPFDAHLSRSEKNLASELRDVRDKWAHGGSFSADDTYRALDTTERLLRAVGSPEAADRVQKLRLEFRRVTSDQDDRRVTRTMLVQSESQGLQPWRDVLQPHEDVASGNFRASEFAADLYKVSTGDPDQSREYTDPVEFFSRTYLTEGLRDLVGRAVARLAGDRNASPVINLQTNFGGGKTHSMLSLWHLASGTNATKYPQDVQDLLAETGFNKLTELGRPVHRVALVGNHLAASGVEHDGVHVNTIWGELAWQLGGPYAYAMVADADRSRTNPGQALHDLLRRYAPAVILIDEWVAYARQLYDREDLAGGTFDTQFTFAQSLTEAVKATPGVLVAISIPASHDVDDVGTQAAAGSAEEVGGPNGQEALRRLQNVVRRVADHWQPASSEESYHIVRRRLFVEPDAEALATISASAREFVGFYRKFSGDFPRDSRESDYEERIKRSYPIHPELFDRLYEDWSTLERFQRTRGVLRLMNTVIHELWTAGDASPLIMPGSVPLSAPSVNAELTQYLSDSWRAIVDADVDGPHSVPAAIDTEKTVYGQRSLTRRLARTVFFGAAPTIGTAHKGLEMPRVFLGTAVPGDVPGNFHSALNHLADRATYFYAGAGRFWYDTQANITRRAKDQAERLHAEDVWAEIVRRLTAHRAHPAGFAGVAIAPDDSADIPDVDEARLVLVHPQYGYSRKSKGESPAAQFAHRATERRGTSNRTNRNMVVFLAGDTDRLEELSASVREYLAWDYVARNAVDLDLTHQQISQATDRRDRADATAADRLLGAYQWVLIPEQPDPKEPFTITSVKAEASATSLAERVTRKLGTDSLLSEERAARLIRMDLEQRLPSVWSKGHVRVGDLWAYYAAYPYMPRLRNREVLSAGVRAATEVLVWVTDAFAVAEEYDSESETYRGLVLPDDGVPIAVHDDLLLVHPDRARTQRAHQLADQVAGVESSPDVTIEVSSAADSQAESSPSIPTLGDLDKQSESRPKARFFGARTLSSERYAVDFKKISDEVLSHLAAVPNVKLNVRVEIDAEAPDGFSDDKIRTVRENANALKFDQVGFEDE